MVYSCWGYLVVVYGCWGYLVVVYGCWGIWLWYMVADGI